MLRYVCHERAERYWSWGVLLALYMHVLPVVFVLCNCTVCCKMFVTRCELFAACQKTRVILQARAFQGVRTDDTGAHGGRRPRAV